MKIIATLFFFLALTASAYATERFVIPGVGSTGCVNAGTNYNPLTNTCGTGSSTVYTTNAGCLNSFGTTAGAGANHSCAVRAGSYDEELTNIMPGGTSASALFNFYCYDALWSCRIDPGTTSVAVIRLANVNSKFSRIRFFEIDGRGQAISDNIVDHSNLSITGVVWESNWIRGGATTGPCLATAELNSFFQIRFNLIEGCMGIPTGGSGSHGIYLKATIAGHLVEGNIIRDNYSHGIHIYPTCNSVTVRKNYVEGNGSRGMICTQGSGSTIDSNIFVANGHATDTSAAIRLNSHDNGKVYNNLIYDHRNTNDRISIEGSGGIARNNICTNVTDSGTCVAGAATTSDNLTSNPGFTNAAGEDFSLTAAATTAINEGTSVAGFLFNGAARDIGPFETFGHSSATVTGNTMDIQLGMNFNTPVLPSSGITGFTVNNSRAVTAASRHPTADSIIRLTFDGAACTDVQTWTYSYSGGNVTDSALIGNSKNQPLHAITAQSVNNACDGEGTPDPPAGLFVHYLLDGNANDETANDNDGSPAGAPTYVTGHLGQAVYMAANEGDSIAVPYGSGVNLTTTSNTIALAVLPDANATAGTYTVFAAPGSTTRAQISSIAGTWSLGVQTSAPAANSEFPVTAAWTRLCVNFNSATDIATLYVNGVVGVSAESVKAYTSFTLAGGYDIGKRSGVTNTLGFAVDDFKLWTSTESCAADYAAWSPPAPDPTGSLTQIAYQWHMLLQDPSGNLFKLPSASASVNTAIKASSGARLTLEIQTDCDDVANCDPIGQILQFDVDNSAAWAPVTDNCISKACFYGTTDTNAAIPGGAPTCPISGALTCVDGGSQRTAAAVPIVDLGQNNSTVNRYLIKVMPAVDEVLRFRVIDQNGNVLGTYSQYPTVTGRNPTTGVGM